MPWKSTTVETQRRELVALMERGVLPVRELCRRFGVSPKTAYKWPARSRAGGDPAWSSDRSRRPSRSPDRVPSEVEQAVMKMASRYPDWGARKVRKLVASELGVATPAASTVQSIFRRHGRVMIVSRTVDHAPGRFEDPVPNGLWQMDFKAMVPLSRGVCQILSVLDDHSRYVVCLEAVRDQRRESVQGALVRAFRPYGLPFRILSDNGPPWGTTGCAGDFSKLEVWLMRLGVMSRHGRPYHPQTQGKVERLHRTLKCEVLSRAGLVDLATISSSLDSWRLRCNHDRPHEALGMEVPASRFRPSPRAYPETLPPLEYEDGDVVRLVHPCGRIFAWGRHVRIGKGLSGQSVALRETVLDGVWEVWFSAVAVGLMDARGPDSVFHRRTTIRQLIERES